MTGLTPSQLGLTINRPYTVSAEAPSFVRELRDEFNYHNVLVGKTHWTPHDRVADLADNLPLMKSLGFARVREIAGPRAMSRLKCELSDLWRQHGLMEKYIEDLSSRYSNNSCDIVRPTILPDNLYPDVWLTNIALEEMHNLPTDKPWLLWISFPGPHEPFDVPSTWSRTRYIPEPEPRPSDPDVLSNLAPEGSVLASKLKRWPTGLDEKSVSAVRQDYANHLELLDAQVERLIAALRVRSDFSSTAITICSDHGELLGDWGLLLKGCFLEGAVRSLFLHRPPGGRSGLRRIWRPDKRAYGLTESLWSAKESICKPGLGSFGFHLRSMPKRAKVAYRDEIRYFQ